MDYIKIEQLENFILQLKQHDISIPDDVIFVVDKESVKNDASWWLSGNKMFEENCIIEYKNMCKILLK